MDKNKNESGIQRQALMKALAQQTKVQGNAARQARAQKEAIM